MKITFLLGNATGMGGTIRTTTNLANHLAKTHDVEVISAVKTTAKPFFELSPDVKLRVLVNRGEQPTRSLRSRLSPKEQVRSYLLHKPSRLIHSYEKYSANYSRYSDRAMKQVL